MHFELFAQHYPADLSNLTYDLALCPNPSQQRNDDLLKNIKEIQIFALASSLIVKRIFFLIGLQTRLQNYFAEKIIFQMSKYSIEVPE